MASIEVEGIRTLAVRVKSSLCCRYTTTSGEDGGAFESVGGGHGFLRKSCQRSAISFQPEGQLRRLFWLMADG